MAGQMGFSTSSRTRRLACLLAGTALASAAFGAACPTWAQDATWQLNPATNDFNTATNWTPATVPAGTATFGASSVTGLTFSAATTVGGLTFNAGAPGYVFVVPSFNSLTLNGSGIINNSSNVPVLTPSSLGPINFQNSASAGNASFDMRFGGTINFSGSSTAGNAMFNGPGGVTFSNVSTAGNATFNGLRGGTFSNASTAGNAVISVSNIQFRDASSAENSTIPLENMNAGFFSNTATAGNARISAFFLFLADASTAGNATITGRFAIFGDQSTAGHASLKSDNIIFSVLSSADNATITPNQVVLFIRQSTGGNARFIINAGASFDMSGEGSSADAPGITAGSIEGAGSFMLGARTLTVGSNNLSTEVSGVISDCGTILARCNVVRASDGSLVKTGTGMLTLSGANTYTGATTVDAGTLTVNGSIASSSGLTVNNGATVSGIGTLPKTTINSGGTLAPGNSIGTMTVNSNLTFNAGSTYLVEVSPTAADRTNVTGTAALSGTVQALFQHSSYVPKSYTILSAAGGRIGQFGSLVSTNVGGGFNTGLSYTATDVLLNLTAALGANQGLAGNPGNVANAINTAFNNGAPLPPAFVPLFNLTGGSLNNALGQLSGEVATGLRPAANLSMGLFLNTMLDPFVTGRNGTFGAAPMGYAAQQPSPVQSRAHDALAAALPVKAPARPVETYENRWSVWGTAYGGRSRIDGNAVAGSSDTSASTGGFAAGADYRVSPGLTLGAAVAIGETRWSTGNVGSGDSNYAQVGGYAAARWNAFYLSGTIAGAWHDTSTQRTITLPGFDRLQADFDASAIGGRVEGGWRNQFAGIGLTPYAAVQVQSLHAPAYSERSLVGGAFGLNTASQTVTDTRTELGVWADGRHVLSNEALAVLRGRAAWVHDFDPESRINAVFQTLPGSSFTVDGATAPRDSALLSAVGEVRLRNGFSFIAKADGEFANRATTYAGTGTVRYSW